MNLFISLGFSCQSKLLIKKLNLNTLSMPYDWCIVTKNFIKKSLNSNNLNHFTPDKKLLKLYEMPFEKTQGVFKDGIWFWHDFKRLGNKINPNWKNDTNYISKYDYLFKKFLKVTKNNEINKKFIISNAQPNLNEFTKSEKDFKKKFSINKDFLESVIESLKEKNVKNFEILTISENKKEYNELIKNKIKLVKPFLFCQKSSKFLVEFSHYVYRPKTFKIS